MTLDLNIDNACVVYAGVYPIPKPRINCTPFLITFEQQFISIECLYEQSVAQMVLMKALV